ncbi:tRNA processing endoribonuclease protein [Rutstroemia sp. NJR-2017a BVV2]|nr:tRNA processing endoribonuclease protein [Rutstroemia sp. NJR-2017a BVV2]
MFNWVQLLTTPTADTAGTAILLHFDDKRYLFGNVSEGTQRVCVQKKVSLIKLGEVFLTGKVDWASTGGLLGMILTLADVTTTSREETFKFKNESAKRKGKEAEKGERAWLNLHGGENLTHLLATARRFIFRKGMPVYTNEYRVGDDTAKENWAPTWCDDNINVWAIAVPSEGNMKSPGKRTHDEFTDDTVSAKGQELKQKEDNALQSQEVSNHQIRKAVVSSMFDSDWRMDALSQMKLKDVQMPATIFHRNEEGKIQKYTGPKPGGHEELPDIEVLVRKPWPGALVESLPSTAPSTSAVSYIVKNHAQRGKFNAKVAIKLKVTPGPDFAKLASGNNVIATDGTTVTPEQVLAEGREGNGFAVIDIPDPTYIKPLLAREEWATKELMSGIKIIYWLLGPGVLADPRVQKFMEEKESIKHIVSSKDCCPNSLAFESSAAQAIRLHLLDAERFPIPTYSNVVNNQPPVGPYVAGKPRGTVMLEPTFQIKDDTLDPFLDTGKVVTEADPEVLRLANQAREEVMNPEYQAKLDEVQKDIPCKDAEIITLGTGSALPSKYRNVSATLLRVPGYGNYLFDCGENTLGQLRRVFGNDLPSVLGDLKAIWISHLHADHHLGTAAVIKAWHEVTSADYSARSKKLVVASDQGMLQWLSEYSEVENFGFERLDLVSPSPKNNLSKWFTPHETEAYGLTSIQACYVDHCRGALAVAFNFPNGFKVAYSGDCRPSKDFVHIGKGATLLIHEATFDDELQGDAIAKKHSTTSEAMDVGKKMGARRILLTHFSQRYQKIPVMDEEAKDQVAIVAFDYMRVKICDFAKLAAFRPALLKLHEEKE